MARVVVTFDLLNSDQVDYGKVTEALGGIGFHPFIEASSGSWYRLPYNTYVHMNVVGASPHQTALAEVKAVFASNGWAFRSVFAADFNSSSFNGPTF